MGTTPIFLFISKYLSSDPQKYLSAFLRDSGEFSRAYRLCSPPRITTTVMGRSKLLSLKPMKTVGPGSTTEMSGYRFANVGPITGTFGSVPWLIYSCSDGKSLVVVSAPGSPAAPFYFLFSPQGGSYSLHGEGTGAKSVTDAALKELHTLRPKDVAVLIRETRDAKKR